MRSDRLRAALLAVVFLLAGGLPALAHRGAWLEQQLQLEKAQRAAKEEAAASQLGAALRASLVAESARLQTDNPGAFQLLGRGHGRAVEQLADVATRSTLAPWPSPALPRRCVTRSALPADDDSEATPERFRLAWSSKTRYRGISLVGGSQHQQPQQFSCEIASDLFQGAWTDPVTGLSYHRARWYDARNASWLSEDPAGTVDSSNLYAYVGWGPQAFTDPKGLNCGDCPGFGRMPNGVVPDPALTPQGRQRAELARLDSALSGMPVVGDLYEGFKALTGWSIRSIADGEEMSRDQRLASAIAVVLPLGIAAQTAKPAVAAFDLPGGTAGTIRYYMANLVHWNSRRASAADLFEVEQTGPYNFTLIGGGEKVDIDGFLGTSILDAKFIEKPDVSPFVPGSSIRDDIRQMILGKVDNEFRRLGAVIADPAVPFDRLEIRVNDPKAAPVFESLMLQHRIPGEVKVVPTSVPQVKRP